jgi:uncharacterized protein (DUF433 family)
LGIKKTLKKLFHFTYFNQTFKVMNNLLQRITMNPNVCFGKPTIRNLRYPIEMLLDLLSAGMTTEELLADYPDLEKEDIQACLLFADRKLYSAKD